MLASLYPVRDMRLSGQVIHTGRSSLEIAVRMEALGDGTEQTVMLGRYRYKLGFPFAAYIAPRSVLHGMQERTDAWLRSRKPSQPRRARRPHIVHYRRRCVVSTLSTLTIKDMKHS